MRSISLFFLLFFVGACFIFCQQNDKKYEVLSVAFYNVENLFDTLNNPNTRDDDRTPTGRDRWTKAVYHKKVVNVAQVLATIGRETANHPPAIIGLCEVENRQVVQDVIESAALKPFDYGIIHFDSPDERGIDVALIYQKNRFLPLSFKNYGLRLYDADGERDYTRDQLLVHGLLEKEPFYFIVNHWPSRSGVQNRSEPARLEAAALNKKIADSILHQNPAAKIINMGDFNDDPTNKSIAEVFKAVGKKNMALKKNNFYNPMYSFYKKGLGTSSYRDRWHVLDQMHVSAGLLKKKGWRFWKAGIYNKPFLIKKTGPYKGYPFRSFSSGRFTGGYSDHFPVYAYLIREVR